MKPLPPKVRWTGSPIEVAIALGLLGPAWLETDDDAEKKLSRENYHPSSELSFSAKQR
jgi:hypothetical protein